MSAHHHDHDHQGDHGHAHSHGNDHGHSHTHGASERRISIAALLTGVFLIAEIAGALISGSLALMADAGHMLTDFASLALAWYGFRLARRPADWKRTYGYDRFSIVIAFANGLTLFGIAGWIAIEAALPADRAGTRAGRGDVLGRLGGPAGQRAGLLGAARR